MRARNDVYLTRLISLCRYRALAPLLQHRPGFLACLRVVGHRIQLSRGEVRSARLLSIEMIEQIGDCLPLAKRNSILRKCLDLAITRSRRKRSDLGYYTI